MKFKTDLTQIFSGIEFNKVNKLVIKVLYLEYLKVVKKQIN